MKPDEIAKKLDLLRKEWEALVPAAKYSILFSIVIIVLIWIDKSLDLTFFESISNNKFNPTLSNLYFLVANILAFLIFIILVLERGYINFKMIYYKWKYPLNKLNKDFFIVSFRGRVCLLDNVKKEVRWIPLSIRHLQGVLGRTPWYLRETTTGSADWTTFELVQLAL